MKRPCDVRLLGTVTYENGMEMQQQLVALRQQETIPDQLLLLEHPPVITLGRGRKEENLLVTREALAQRGIRFHETTRGGDITYHGPGQIVGYPILHLGEGNRDIRKYVTKLEEVLIRTVAHYGITAVRSDLNRGIWVGRNKLAAIGVRIARWVTSHGFALNVAPDLDHFNVINPCGLRETGVTSIERLTGAAPDVDEIREKICLEFAEVFERELTSRPEDMRVVKVVAHDGDRVLLLQRKATRAPAFWQPVTGRVEEGEQLENAARRELREETGQDAILEDLQLEQSFLIAAEFLKDPSRPLFASEKAFAARIDSSIPIVIDAEEHDAFGWFTFEEAYGMIRWTDDREAIERIAKRYKQA